MPNKDVAIIEKDEGQSPFDLSIAASASLIAVAEEAEKRQAALLKIKMVALKATNPGDWVDEGGKPYLQASGGEKIARIFGLSWRISEPVKEELGNGHYSFTYTGEFALWGSVIAAVGTRSSKDPFFKKYEWKGEGEKRTRVELPVTEIDPGDVKKSAYTNLLANGITRLLGIRNLTWEDLKKFADISQEQVSRVEFKKGGKPQPAERKPAQESKSTEPTKPAGDSNGQVTEPQGRMIHAILKDRLHIEDELGKMQKVATILDLKEVPTSVSKLTKAQASKVIETLQKEAEKGGEK